MLLFPRLAVSRPGNVFDVRWSIMNDRRGLGRMWALFSWLTCSLCNDLVRFCRLLRRFCQQPDWSSSAMVRHFRQSNMAATANYFKSYSRRDMTLLGKNVRKRTTRVWFCVSVTLAGHFVPSSRAPIPILYIRWETITTYLIQQAAEPSFEKCSARGQANPQHEPIGLRQPDRCDDLIEASRLEKFAHRFRQWEISRLEKRPARCGYAMCSPRRRQGFIPSEPIPTSPFSWLL